MSEIRQVLLRDLLTNSQNGLSKRSGDEGQPTAVLRLADISNGVIDETNPREIMLTDQEIEKYELLVGDLVCIRVNGSKSLVGRVVPFRSTRKWAYCDHFIRLRPRQAIVDSRYLAYYLQTRRVRRHVELNMVSSAGQNTVSQGTMLDVLVPLPSLVKQRRAVAEIEEQFSRLDEAVASLQRVKGNLRRYKASLLQEAFDGELVETEAHLARRYARNYESGEDLVCRMLQERQAKRLRTGTRAEALSPIVSTKRPTPEGWTWTTVETVCEAIVDCPHSTAKFQAAGYPCIDTTWISPEGLALDSARYVDEATYLARVSRLVPRAGDVVFAREGTIGTAVLIPACMTPCLGQRVMLLRPDSKYVARLLVHVLHSEVVKSQYRAQALGSTVAHINVGDVKRFVIPVPPLQEQIRIVAEVDRRLSLVREVEAEVDTNLKRAQSLREAILAKAFSGAPT